MYFKPIEISIKPVNRLVFNLGNITVGGHLPYYEGDYVVTPRVWEQVLLTDEKSMRDDVTVEAIPLSKVSNPQGGYTATIG